MLGKIEGRRRRGQQRMRWLDGITNSMDMSLSKLGVSDGQESLVYCSLWGHRVEHDWATELNWTCLLEQPHRVQHTRPPCPAPTPGVYSKSCPLSPWSHPTTSSSVVPFSSCLQSFPASGSFQVSQFFTSGGQSIGASASASVLPVNIQDLFSLGWTGLLSVQSKGLSRVVPNTTVQKYQLFGAQLSL